MHALLYECYFAFTFFMHSPEYTKGYIFIINCMFVTSICYTTQKMSDEQYDL